MVKLTGCGLYNTGLGDYLLPTFGMPEVFPVDISIEKWQSL